MKASRIRPFGYDVSGIDLSAGLSGDDFAMIKGLLNDQGMVLFRDQDLDASAQASLSRKFGPFSAHNDSDRSGLEDDGTGFSLRIYTNREGIGAAPELDFHSDNAHNEFSLRYLSLYGIDFGKGEQRLIGGETILASAADAVERLPGDLRARLEGMRCRISAQSMGSFVRPCIERHCETGRPYLVPSSLTEEFIGLDADESAALMMRLREIIYDPDHVYRHAWREGDLLLWDNRMLHHGRGLYDNARTRIIRRCAIADEREPTAVF